MKTVKDFWQDQALEYEEGYKATNPDYYSFTKEIQTLKKHLNPDEDVLEYGCGNGYASQRIFQTHCFSSYLGVDYSENMIDIASKANDIASNSYEYQVGNVMNHQTAKKYDTIFTDRCLINLANHDEQVTAMINIHSNLRKGGRFLMMECSKKSLANINEVRNDLGLPIIQERWHNCYIDEDRLFKDTQEYYTLEQVDSFASSYFLISRTINAVVGQKTGVIDYLSTVNKVASQLPSEGDYAPLKLFVLRKK